MKQNNQTEADLHSQIEKSIDSLRRNLVVSMLLVGTLVSTVFAVLNFLDNSILLGVAETVVSILLLSMLMVILITNSISGPRWVISVILLGITALLVAQGGLAGVGLFWLFGFPAMFFLMWERKLGNIWLVVMVIIPAIFIILNLTGVFEGYYKPINLIQFIGSFLLAWLFAYVYQMLQDRQRDLLEKNANKQAMLAESAFKQRKQLQAVLNSIGDGVIVMDAKRHIILANPVAQTLTGYSEEELLERPFSEALKFIDDRTGAPVTEFLETVFVSGKMTTLDFHTSLIRKDGSRMAVGDSAAPILNNDGIVTGGIIVFRDNTREREVDTMKTEFVSLASHQLQTPITELQYLLELLKDRKLLEGDMDVDELVSKAYEVSQSMSHLVSDLLDVSRIETGRKFTVNMKPVVLNQFLTETAEGLKGQAAKRNIRIEVLLPAEEITVNADAGKLGEVVSNLLSNALKYSHPESEVQLRLTQREDVAVIEVEDHGIGIPREQQGSIFTKLFRAENAVKSDIEGTGLGLYIAKAITEAHGGKLFFESVENERTVFTLELPVHQEPAAHA
ncbi:MAG: Alkaline phosphatase synthesis sensor protein PhoR [candidate division WS6 bacterium OLB20]|uniref:histidine kinase n=1 Tax=candidate division WS6 bacterium OLB20 TaxID=1617426 RepID=A0A136M004_9BACT|nr:MAG: Alkaline phosphatase synthesis sensor protein PhoR [candidate division WS6 bacterium OLB20]